MLNLLVCVMSTICIGQTDPDPDLANQIASRILSQDAEICNAGCAELEQLSIPDQTKIFLLLEPHLRSRQTKSRVVVSAAMLRLSETVLPKHKATSMLANRLINDCRELSINNPSDLSSLLELFPTGFVSPDLELIFNPEGNRAQYVCALIEVLQSLPDARSEIERELPDLLADSSPDVRAAATVLACMCDPQLGAAACLRASSEESMKCKFAAISGLETIVVLHNEEYLSGGTILKNAVLDSEPKLREAAVQLFHQAQSTVVLNLDDADLNLLEEHYDEATLEMQLSYINLFARLRSVKPSLVRRVQVFYDTIEHDPYLCRAWADYVFELVRRHGSVCKAIEPALRDSHRRLSGDSEVLTITSIAMLNEQDVATWRQVYEAAIQSYRTGMLSADVCRRVVSCTSRDGVTPPRERIQFIACLAQDGGDNSVRVAALACMCEAMRKMGDGDALREIIQRSASDDSLEVRLFAAEAMMESPATFDDGVVLAQKVCGEAPTSSGVRLDGFNLLLRTQVSQGQTTQAIMFRSLESPEETRIIKELIIRHLQIQKESQPRFLSFLKDTIKDRSDSRLTRLAVLRLSEPEFDEYGLPLELIEAAVHGGFSERTAAANAVIRRTAR